MTSVTDKVPTTSGLNQSLNHGSGQFVNVTLLEGVRRVKAELSKPMTTANCTGNEELDFRLMFGEDGQQQPLGPAGKPQS